MLLILAGVALSSVLGQDGIFSRADQATGKYGQAKARETLELALSEVQMQKYESGLTDEQLTKKINKIGEELPERTDPDISQAIVDGYIFEIDRTVPKILDYLGKADGIIITAIVSNNTTNGWIKPSEVDVRITGKIKTYSGGTIASVSAKKGEEEISGFSIDEEGRYTITNITEDTTVIISATDSNNKEGSKSVPIVIRKDTIPPVLSEAKAEAVGMKIKISVKAEDNETGLKQINYSISPATVDSTTPAKGTLESGVEKEIITTVEGKYTVTFMAEDNSGNKATATVETTTTKTMSVEEAKELVKSTSDLKKYIGEKVNYKPGETWQIFYFDEEVESTGKGEFGPANTLYLKKAWSAADTKLTLSSKTSTTDPAVKMMRNMNPQWASSSYSEINLNNEKACIWLCDPSIWNSERNEIYSSYAIGSPSVEMYMKAFNVYKTGNKDATNLVCKVEKAFGYSVGVNNNYMNSGYYTSHNAVVTGPNNIFIASEGKKLWLSSPSNNDGNQIRTVDISTASINKESYNNPAGIGLVVPLDL